MIVIFFLVQNRVNCGNDPMWIAQRFFTIAEKIRLSL